MSRSGYVYGKPSPTGEQLYPIRVDSSVTVLVLIEGSGMGFNDRAAGSLKPRGLTRWRLCCPHRRRRVRHDRGGLVAGGLAHPRRSVVKSYRRQRERGVLTIQWCQSLEKSLIMYHYFLTMLHTTAPIISTAIVLSASCSVSRYGEISGLFTLPSLWDTACGIKNYPSLGWRHP